MKNKLTLSELWATGTGMCVGSGIMVLIGAVMSFNGRSAWLTFALAVGYGFCMNIPYFFMSKTMIIQGGQYAMANAFVGRFASGALMILQFCSCLGNSVMCLALGTYICSVFPSLNATVVALVAATAFYVINLLGVKSFAKAQNIMSWVLLACIVMFIVMGFAHGFDPRIFDFSDPEFMTGGGIGFIRGVCMMSYSCWGYYCLMNYSNVAAKPKENVPKSMFLVIPTIFVLYVGCALTFCGVTTLEEGAGQVLTVAAVKIMPPFMVKIFVLGGAGLALTTTLNVNMSNNAVVIQNATKDGWLPSSLAKTNKADCPFIILTVVYLVTILPIVLNLSIGALINNLTLTTALMSLICWLAVLNSRKKHADKYTVSSAVWNIGMAVALIAQAGLVVYGVLTLSGVALTVNAAYIVIALVYAFVRLKGGKVREMQSVYYFDEADIPQAAAE